MILQTAIRLQSAYANVGRPAPKWFAGRAALPKLHQSVSCCSARDGARAAKILRLSMFCRCQPFESSRIPFRVSREGAAARSRAWPLSGRAVPPLIQTLLEQGVGSCPRSSLS
ncbi:hypothetical protein Bcep1808_1088 [Burkholderia vietnamiensis G4]|uniref:Uncharacterized protein n=1 Tax=Burkholderia vietnamiensis (strain G4 / LMG 22486) TaxID=269482 RepID=A4JCU6_BURVG|nr:hypothetical protein Bcep1808_1088 [Burkholderia vietnamiensis G4]